MSVWVDGHEVRSAGKQENPPPAIGQLIGKYRVVRDLGTAGLARVFLAALEGPGGFSKMYVIKRISPAQVPNPRLASVLANEASVAAALDHANVIRLLEFFFQDDDDSYFLVIEHVDGVSLDHLLRAARRARAPLGPDVAAEIGLPLARALAHVHGLGRVDGGPGDFLHGDVAASNVLVSREGMVKLTNVGVANSAVATQSVAGLNAKLSYMSPEQLAGRRADQRSDLFSLGMILYEVATGVRLGGGESPGVAELEAMAGVALLREPVTETGAGPSFAGIVAKLLRRDPAGRHQSAAALVADLEALRASRPTSVRILPLADAVKACLAAAEAAPLSPPPTPAEPVGPPPVSTLIGARVPEPEPAPYRPAPLAIDADETPVPLVLAVSLACLIGSLIFWFVVF